MKELFSKKASEMTVGETVKVLGVLIGASVLITPLAVLASFAIEAAHDNYERRKNQKKFLEKMNSKEEEES